MQIVLAWKINTQNKTLFVEEIFFDVQTVDIIFRVSTNYWIN